MINIYNIPTETIYSRIQRSDGYTSGFDYLRIFLAVSVIASHVALTTYGENSVYHKGSFSGYMRPFVASIVPVFFALSGFLVAGSMARSKRIIDFALLRVLRLVPALAFEVFISALLVGPLITLLPLNEYFSDVKFWAYFLNIIGEIHYELPGVFNDNPAPKTVNAQLWTIPSELKCYLLLVFLMLVGLRSKRWIVLAAITCLLVISTFTILVNDPTSIFRSGFGQTERLYMYFLCGVAAYLYSERIPLHPVMFIASVALSYLLLLNTFLTTFAFIPITYVTLFLGLTDTKKTWIIQAGDYSYGVYLYGFPLQQTYAYLAGETRTWYGNFTFTLVAALICAAVSWKLVERPVHIRRKSIIGRITGHRLVSSGEHLYDRMIKSRLR